MATPALDPKAALLAEDLKEFALTLPATAFPKNFSCALCSQLAFDSWKLLCCNKSICSPCQAKLEFPTSCPSCEHSPLESDSCSPNKSLRNTMRVWLQKQKKKEEAKAEAKAASQAATPIVEAPPAAPEVQASGDSTDKPVESVEGGIKGEDASGDQDPAAMESVEQTAQRAGSTASQMNEDSTASNETARRGSTASQALSKAAEPSTEDAPDAQGNQNATGDMFGNNAMMNMNGMQGQFGYGFNPNQGNFNGMGWNGMGPMNSMQNMMGNGNWNGMNPMDFNMNNNMNGMPNMANGMYGGNFGGNMGMGMGMNDMSMNMNYGGGYGNGWNGMGGGYGNFNGFNQMGGFNQSGAYPEMNQYPKNNFPNQNRFNANGGALPQRNIRKGSQGGFGPGSGAQNNASSRPESRSGPQQSRDGESPDGNANATAPGSVVEDEQEKASSKPLDEGKENTDEATVDSMSQGAAASGAMNNHVDNLTRDVGNETDGMKQSGGLNQIQTVDSGEPSMSHFDPSMMNNVMQPNMPYPQGMMDQFQQGSNMNGSYNPNMNMNMNMGYGQNNYGPRGGGGGFNAAYGAATVLTGEPRGVGVEGAPTGPRAMREGRPNTGFSSRNNPRHNPPPKSVTPAQEKAPGSPPRRVRSRSPQRDDSLRTKDKSPSRSRSGSRARNEDKNGRDRSRSPNREDKREERVRSPTPKDEDDYERRKERRHHRSSRYDDRDDDYDDQRREDRDDRGDRTRSVSADSKYRSSRRDKEKYRSSRSHRDRSREHRRRHRSRSRSVVDDKYEDGDGYGNGDQHSESGSRRKHRSEREKHRDRDRDRSRDRDRDRDRRDRKDRDRDRDRDRDYEHDYEREKDRSREKERERKRRREREAEEDERDYDDDKHRSSRRSRKDRDRDRERDRERDYDKEPSSATSARPPSPPLNAPTGPSANGFTIKGRSKNTMAPPTGPRALQPPKGPAAERERRDSREHRRKESVSSVTSTPATPTTQDHYAAERERNARERDRLDRDNRETLVKNIHARVTSRPSLSSKRSRDEFEPSESTMQDKPVKAPTGPSAHRDKRKKSGGDDNITKLFTAGLRKNAGKTGSRRGGVRTEGDVERELERVERERDRR